MFYVALLAQYLGAPACQFALLGHKELALRQRRQHRQHRQHQPPLFSDHASLALDSRCQQMPEQCRYKLQIDLPIALFTHYSSHFLANKCHIMAFCSTGYNKCYQMRQLTDACSFVIAKLWTCSVPLGAPVVVLLRRAPTLARRRSASQNDPSCMDTKTITAGVMRRHQCGSKLLIEEGPAKKIYENGSTMWGSSHKSNPVYNL